MYYPNKSISASHPVLYQKPTLVIVKLLTSHLGIRLVNDECRVIFDRVTKMPNER